MLHIRFAGYAGRVLLILCTVFLSCEKEAKNTLADVPEPIKEMIASNAGCSCEPFIDRYLWRDQIIYTQSCRGPACLCVVLYYDAEGKPFALPQGYTFTDFHQEADFQKNIWTCGK